MPVSTGNLNDGLIAFADGKMITMKVPYPTGFYAKGLDGRIDDPKTAGKAVACGRRAATACPGTRKAAWA